MESGLSGKVALITGASGGIGIELARSFASEDARLVLQARTQLESLQRIVEEEGWGDRALCLAYDVADRDASFDAMARAIDRFGRVDACVANAGIWPTDDVPLHRMSEERLRRTIEVNLLGATWTAQAFLDGLERCGARDDGQGASLVFIGSTAGRFGERDHCDYSLTKAAMYGLVRTLKNEIVRLDRYGRVNLVEPGWTATPMAETALRDDDTVTHVARTMALRQFARAADIARVVTFLCSPLLARHVSGESITVAGGMEGRLLWAKDEVGPAEIRARLERE